MMVRPGSPARLATLLLLAGIALPVTPRVSFAGVWPDGAPADCPFPKSDTFAGIELTGRHAEYTRADTWYPSWAADGHLYSPFTDGTVDAVRSSSGENPREAVTGGARIEGDDPLHLKVLPIGVHKSPAVPYGGRYPCGSLVYNGVWYYGTYCLDWHKNAWDIMGPFVGFRMSSDGGKTWQETPCTPDKPLFGEVLKSPDQPAKGRPNVTGELFRKMPKVKIGSPHFVDFGKNMEHSPDGKAYLLGHGATRTNATCSWISGDQVYLIRVKPSPETINDVRAYEFFAGHDAKGEPVWVKDFSRIKPLLEWNDRLGCVTATWNPVSKRFLMCVTDGGESGYGTYDTLILEAEALTGPWRRIAFMEKFGQQAYFVNIPSKFISTDGCTMWLCYAANWHAQGIRSDPPGSRYGMCLQEIRFLPTNTPKPIQASLPR